MIELRGLHLGNIARSPAESVRPDLWPTYAWAPVLGRMGGVVFDLAGGAHAAAYGWSWSSADGFINTSAGDRFVSPATISISSVASFFFAGTIYSKGVGTSYGRVFDATGVVFNFNNALSSLDYPGATSVTGMPISTSTQSLCVAYGDGSGGLYVDGKIEHSNTTSKSASYGLSFAVGNNASGTRTGDQLTRCFFVYGATKLQPSQVLALHTDPILPFRRRQPVYYSVPSGGGATRNLIAALTGESATGTISAIIARALAGDVTATSITGAITASMARDLLASLQGQSTTGDAAATLQRLLLASLGCASTTGDVAATMSGLVSLIAAINGQSATGAAAATQARSLLADLQASSTTPDIAATLAALVALTASISGTTTTPAVAATMARAIAASLSGQSTTGAVAVEFAGMLLLVASISGTSTTGALTTTTGRELRASIAAASSTGIVDGQLLRQIAATIAGASLTGSIASELVNLVSLAASVVGVSVTPDVLATISRDLAAEVAAGSTTGAASATVARTLAAAVEAGSLTPDNLVLILTGLGILHDTTIISRTPRRGISSRTVRRTLHSA